MKIKPNFLRKIKVKNKMSSAAIFLGALRFKLFPTFIKISRTSRHCNVPSTIA